MASVWYPAATPCSYVYFDMETSGQERKITQIAARRSDFDTCNFYVRPLLPLMEVTESMYDKDTNRMFKPGWAVPSVQLALLNFAHYLKRSANVVLLGHNAKAFDCHVLLYAAATCGMVAELRSALMGFVDTYLLLREQRPDLEGAEEHAYKLENLARRFASAEVDTSQLHDASVDVRALELVMRRSGCIILSHHLFTI